MSSWHWHNTYCPVFQCGHLYETNHNETIPCPICGISISETMDTNDRELIYAEREKKRKERYLLIEKLD